MGLSIKIMRVKNQTHIDVRTAASRADFCDLLKKRLPPDILRQEAPQKSIIPGYAFNILPLHDMKAEINRLHIEANDPRTALSWRIATIKKRGISGFGGLEHHKKFCASVSEIAELKGPFVYYPFGGFDAHTPFWVVGDATDVISVAFEPFGSINDIIKFFRTSDSYYRAGYNYDAFDPVSDYDTIMKDNGLTGLGSLAITRIISFLEGELTGIYHFEIKKNGSVLFLNENKIDAEKSAKNAVVAFIDPDGKEKRYWYISHDMDDYDIGFSRFIEQLKFQTLFIKGAPDNYLNQKESIQRTFDPAKRNAARVVADSTLIFGQRPIWTTDPKRIRVPRGIYYGYSDGTTDVYHSSAEDLITARTLPRNIRNYLGQQ